MSQKENKSLEELPVSQIYWKLFKNIFVIIGMIKQKFTEKLHWISEEEILDMTAIAQSAPGPLGVNMAIITGYRIRKIPGALICTLGAVLPPLITVSVISLFYNQLRDNVIIARALQVMRAGVAAVIVDVVVDLASNIFKTKNVLLIIAMIVAFVATVFFKVSAIVLILICSEIGLFYGIMTGRRKGDK